MHPDERGHLYFKMDFFFHPLCSHFVRPGAADFYVMYFRAEEERGVWEGGRKMREGGERGGEVKGRGEEGKKRENGCWRRRGEVFSILFVFHQGC